MQQFMSPSFLCDTASNIKYRLEAFEGPMYQHMFPNKASNQHQKGEEEYDRLEETNLKTKYKFHPLY